MRRARWLFTVGLFLVILGACNISIKPAGIVIGMGALLVVWAIRSFVDDLNGK